MPLFSFCALQTLFIRKSCIEFSSFPSVSSFTISQNRLLKGQERSTLKDHLAYYFSKLRRESDNIPPGIPLLLDLQLMGVLKFQFGKSCDVSEILKQFNFHASEVTINFDETHQEGCKAFIDPTKDWFVPTTAHPNGSCSHLFSTKTTLCCQHCGRIECTIQRKIGNCFILKVDSDAKYVPLFVQIKKANLNSQLTEKTPQLKSIYLFAYLHLIPVYNFF